MVDHGGRDATEDFEEVEHSNAALEILSTLKVGTLKRQASKEHFDYSAYISNRIRFVHHQPRMHLCLMEQKAHRPATLRNTFQLLFLEPLF